MNQPDNQIVKSPAALSTARPAHWLIVLLPSLPADLTPAIRRVWELAEAGERRVRFIGVYENAAQELGLRRELAGLSAMTGTAGIHTETELAFKGNIREVVRSCLQPGDMLVCFAGQRTLIDVLESSLHMPVFILSDLSVQDRPRNWQALLPAWAGSIALIAGFFLIQVRIDQISRGVIHLLLFLISVCLEIWMIWVWNNFFA